MKFAPGEAPGVRLTHPHGSLSTRRFDVYITIDEALVPWWTEKAPEDTLIKERVSTSYVRFKTNNNLLISVLLQLYVLTSELFPPFSANLFASKQLSFVFDRYI